MFCDRRDPTSETASEKVKFEKLVIGESVDPADDETSGPRGKAGKEVWTSI